MRFAAAMGYLAQRRWRAARFCAGGIALERSSAD
jgi:hypothetical protein